MPHNVQSFGVPGLSVEHIGADAPAPEWVAMPDARPSASHVCSVADGVAEWVELEVPRDYRHFAPNDFMALFAPERLAIMAAKAADVDVAIWYDETLAARYVTYSDPKTQAGLAFMLQAELLTQARHDEIVAALTSEREG